jgi:acyl transferase domain-containing protein
MSDALLGDDLNELMAMETHGLLTFLEASTPYVTPAMLKAWAGLKAMAAGAAQRAAKITAMLQVIEAPVRAASFETDVASLHYASLEKLLPRLAKENRQQVEAAQRAVDHASEHPEMRATLEAMLAEHRKQQAWLEKQPGAGAGAS